MIVLGLTGSIGMGKSTAAALLRRLGVPVHDADASVHRLLGRDGAAVQRVAAAFPGTGGANGIDRAELGRRVFDDKAALRRLEQILHPMVRAESERFLRTMAARRVPIVVLDIPLLFELPLHGLEHAHAERREAGEPAQARLRCRRAVEVGQQLLVVLPRRAGDVHPVARDDAFAGERLDDGDALPDGELLHRSGGAE